MLDQDELFDEKKWPRLYGYQPTVAPEDYTAQTLTVIRLPQLKKNKA